MVKNGSQTIEKIDDTPYIIHARHKNELVLYNKITNKEELFTLNNDFAGYVVQLHDGTKWEFVRTLNSDEAMRMK